MLHEPATPSGKDPAGPYKMRLGIWMFLFYSLFYALFVAINLLSPQAMGAVVFLGLNLATVYGFALIIVALIQALIYDALCRKKEAEFAQAEKQNDVAASPARATPAKANPAKTTSAKTTSAKTTSVKSSPKKSTSTKIDPSKSNPSKTNRKEGGKG